jgi:CBS domain-containing protein
MTIAFFLSRVKDVMTPCPQLMSPAATLQQAARKMATTTCGALPVGTPDKFQGIITSDIVVQAIAQGKNAAKEVVAGFMDPEAPDCYENDTLESAAEIMHLRKSSRLIVRNRQGKVTGILSFEALLCDDIGPEQLARIVKHTIEPVYI